MFRKEAGMHVIPGVHGANVVVYVGEAASDSVMKVKLRGWAFVADTGASSWYLAGAAGKDLTQYQVELLACILALESLPFESLVSCAWCGVPNGWSGCPTLDKCDVRTSIEGSAESVALFSTSKYAVRGISSVPVWRSTQWQTAKKSPVANRDLWERLFRLSARHRVQWRLAGRDNTRGVALAREAASTAVLAVFSDQLGEGVCLQQMISSKFDASGGVEHIHLPSEGLEWAS